MCGRPSITNLVCYKDYMDKRVIIVHGWDGYPKEAWFPWLKMELEKKGFYVQAPAMPQPDRPTIESWVLKLAEIVGEPDQNTYLVGHSIGCQTILRYLSGLDGKKVGGIVLVAGFFELRPLETENEEQILKPWIETPIDFAKVRQACENITAIFSDNDPWVPMERNIELFKKNLGEDITVIREHDKQHFSQNSGVVKLPLALQAISGYASKE